MPIVRTAGFAAEAAATAPASAPASSAHAAAAENVGNFFGEDIFIAVGAILLMKGFFEAQGLTVSVWAMALWGIPTALAAFAVMAWRARAAQWIRSQELGGMRLVVGGGVLLVAFAVLPPALPFGATVKPFELALAPALAAGSAALLAHARTAWWRGRTAKFHVTVAVVMVGWVLFNFWLPLFLTGLPPQGYGFLRAEIISEIPQPGEYQLVCLPLKIAGADGAPARAVLIG